MILVLDGNCEVSLGGETPRSESVGLEGGGAYGMLGLGFLRGLVGARGGGLGSGIAQLSSSLLHSQSRSLFERSGGEVVVSQKKALHTSRLIMSRGTGPCVARTIMRSARPMSTSRSTWSSTPHTSTCQW